jgi:hypothetical protein
MTHQTSFQIYRLDGGGKNPMLVNQLSTLGDEHVGGDLYVAGNLHVSGTNDTISSGSDTYWQTVPIGGQTALQNTGTGYIHGYELYTGRKRIDAAAISLRTEGALDLIAHGGVNFGFSSAAAVKTVTDIDSTKLTHSSTALPTSAAVSRAIENLDIPTTYWESKSLLSLPVLTLKSGVYAVVPQVVVFSAADDITQPDEYWAVTCERGEDDGSTGSHLEIVHKVPGGDDGSALVISSNGTITLNGKQVVTSAKVPDPPSTDATYVLTATVSDGVPTYSWRSTTK